jgi:alpha-1,2-mannosyltransferase
MPGDEPASLRGGDLDLRRADVRDSALFSVAFSLLVLALWLDVRFATEILSRISANAMYVHVDFHTFWHSAAALLEGGDVYGTGARLKNLNPPFWVLLSSPLGLLEPLLAYRVFVLITLGITVGYLIWMAAEVGLRSRWAVVAVAMLLLSGPLLGTLALGQIYPVLTLGLVAAWVADRRERFVLSGVSLGLVVALKPSLVPVLLWPLVRRRWGAFGAALASGAAATLVGAVVVGPRATLNWLRLLSEQAPSPYWDNASLSGAAVRLFTANEFAANIATLPWTIPLAYALGIGAIAITAARARQGSGVGLWGLVAASLLASPIAWHNYLLLLGPAILLLLARGRAAPAFLLLALQAIPGQWSLLWSERETVLASLALTLYLYILIAHWLVLISAGKVPTGSPALETGGPKRGSE